ncbi:MAG: Holliday junction branch migration protein RuvA [bacterium]|nr:Holliday junction branch migration protein RuvA [bacterium]
MIAYLKGTCLQSSAGRVTVLVNGVGYDVMVPDYAANLAQGTEVALYTQLIVRENDMYLVGFYEAAEREMFKLLTSISGIGPKLAVKVLSALNPSALINCVAENDGSLLKRVPGLGTKGVSRILNEMPAKIKAISKELPVDGSSARVEAEAVLVSLGCDKEEAAALIKNAVAVNPDADAEELVMTGMRLMGEQKQGDKL